jgi:hypothetical protein
MKCQTYQEYLSQHNDGEQLIKEAQQELEKAQDESKKADGEVSKFVDRGMPNLETPQSDKDSAEMERLYGEQESAHSKKERMDEHLKLCEQLLKRLESDNPEFTERLKDNPEDAAKVDQQAERGGVMGTLAKGKVPGETVRGITNLLHGAEPPPIEMPNDPPAIYAQAPENAHQVPGILKGDTGKEAEAARGGEHEAGPAGHHHGQGSHPRDEPAQKPDEDHDEEIEETEQVREVRRGAKDEPKTGSAPPRDPNPPPGGPPRDPNTPAGEPLTIEGGAKFGEPSWTPITPTPAQNPGGAQVPGQSTPLEVPPPQRGAEILTGQGAPPEHRQSTDGAAVRNDSPKEVPAHESGAEVRNVPQRSPHSGAEVRTGKDAPIEYSPSKDGAEVRRDQGAPAEHSQNKGGAEVRNDSPVEAPQIKGGAEFAAQPFFGGTQLVDPPPPPPPPPPEPSESKGRSR